MNSPIPLPKRYLFQIGLAGKTVQIESSYRRIYDECRAYLVQGAVPDLFVSPSRESLAAMTAEALTPDGQPQGPWMPTEDVQESMAVCTEIANSLLSSDLMLMHGAVVAKDGFGYMITAPSGTGKTTRLLRWLEAYPDSVVVNGDKPLVQLSDDPPLAYGTPWCGKEGMSTNMAVPLRAIFCLERAGVNRVTRLSPAAAYLSLFPMVYQPADIEASRRVLRLLRRLISQVAVYRFQSEPTREAVRLAWESARPR